LAADALDAAAAAAALDSTAAADALDSAAADVLADARLTAGTGAIAAAWEAFDGLEVPQPVTDAPTASTRAPTDTSRRSRMGKLPAIPERSMSQALR